VSTEISRLAGRTLKWVKKRLYPRAIILMYHRIADPPIDPRGTAVSPGRFAEQLQILKESFTPISLADLVIALRSGPIPRRAVAVTFDDGYVNTFTEAGPLLASIGIPATVYVSTGYLGSSRAFWWDELDRVLLMPEYVPAQIRVQVNGREWTWPTQEPGQRWLVCDALHRLMRVSNSQERENVLDSLIQWSGLEKDGWADCRPMTPTELVQLTSDGLLTLGAHTVSHPVLSALSAEDQQAEILRNLQQLEALVGKKVDTFAYPYGTVDEFDEASVEIVRTAGFLAACTAIQGVVEAGSDPHQLRRFAVLNWDAETFLRNLNSFFHR